MTKRSRQDRISRRNNRRADDAERQPFSMRETRQEKVKELKPRNDRQARYLNQLRHETLTFGLGAAGTGKTYLAAFVAGDLLEAGVVDRIIVTRPIVEAGENLGFLPGDVMDKIGPYFVPIYEALCERLGSGQVQGMMASKRIEFVPFAFMRGRTFKNAFVILDEAQNTTPSQMKMFLTRAGERSKLSVNGDLLQSDIPGTNGLQDAVNRFRGKNGVGVTVFKREDVVRSTLAAIAVDAYEGDDGREQHEALGRLPDFVTRPSYEDQLASPELLGR